MLAAALHLTVLLTLCLSFACAVVKADDDDTHGERIRRADAPLNGDATLILSEERQRTAGIQTEALTKAEWRAENPAFATLVDLQPLLEQRARYRAAQAEVRIAQAAQQVAEKNLKRLGALHRESIIPARELFQAEAQHAADLARLEAARNRLREVHEAALQQWGETLFREVIVNETPLFRALLDRQCALVLVTVPDAPHHPGPARLAAPTGGSLSRPARLLAAAPRVDATTQGSTWFYVLEQPEWRAGQRLKAWLEDSAETKHGVAIPLSAVLWHEGRPWVYVKSGSERFTRRPIAQHHPRNTIWLVDTGFAPGEAVVVSGAQALLSEELRRFIPTEDDD